MINFSRRFSLPLVLGLLLAVMMAVWGRNRLLPPQDTPTTSSEHVFDGALAYQYVAYQMALGARTPGSAAHLQVRDWIRQTLTQSGWAVKDQTLEVNGHFLHNLIARRGTGSPYLLLGAHYDSRLLADQDADPALRVQPVPGANDGASGVAILMALGSALPLDAPGTIELVFFDGEDNGNIPTWDWLLGSRAFVEHLQQAPDAAIILDMVGDRDLNLYQEKNSTFWLVNSIWQQAGNMGLGDVFIPHLKYAMLDDHTPFLQAGIPAVDIIDFDYPAWHTTGDTLDKVSQESLFAVGQTMLMWITASDGWQIAQPSVNYTQ